MVRSKTGKAAQKVVWRITPARPAGEFVQVKEQASQRASSSETHERGFVVSSLDLLCGADVTETPLDTLPGELLDAFLQRPPTDSSGASPTKK